MAERRIVVVGAGVVGLTTAMLASRNPYYRITVAAKNMPGDYDIEYASPWAGANFFPVSAKGTRAAEWDRETWPELEKLARVHPESGIQFQELAVYNRTKDDTLARGVPWFKDTVPGYRTIPKDQLPPGVDSGDIFTSVCINTTIYLPWLVSQCLEAGVVFKRNIFSHISDAVNAHHSGKRADLIVNCTGLSAGKLGGVEDKNMIPVRGQTVLVRNECEIGCGIDDRAENLCYVMQRPAGGGTLLGGCTQKGNWDPQVDLNLANRIMKRAVDVCPALTGGKSFDHLDIIRHGVGLRPLRLGGTRLEKEKIEGVWVVHSYGHGGYGYQSSYGCSQAAVKLIDEALSLKATSETHHIL
ncbi:hypothetical protein MMC29_008370 [Sticta canariensis]|nr:hypothetical protein [Sticta canariensis]